MPLCRLHTIQAASPQISTYNTSTSLSIPLGIFFGLLASFIQSLGLTIQRKSHVLNQLLPEHEQRVEYKRPLWLVGTAIFVSSNVVGSLVQIASLPVVILAPLGAVSLLWNAFFARVILGDVFSPWMILGTVLIAGGAVLIAIFGIVPEPTRSLEDLLKLFSRSTFIIYFSMLGFVVLVCLLVTHIAEFRLSRQTAHIKLKVELPTSPNQGSIHRLSSITIEPNTPTERAPLLDPKPTPPSPSLSIRTLFYSPDVHKTRVWLAVSYASISGIISGMCLLFAKSGVELLLLTLRGQNQFWRWQAWLLVLGLVIFALLQLWYLHKALVLADPTLVCPSAFCFYNLSSIINGLVYFDQFALIPPLHLGLVGLGICVLLCGVWVVSTQSGPKVEDYESGSDSDGESSVQSETQTIYSESGLRAPGLLRATRSESAADDLEVVAIETGVSGRDYGTLAAGPSQPHHQQRRRTTHEEGTPSREHGTHHRDTLSPPLVPLNTSATLTSGFSIGLSPVSPGFVIVPTERGRRLSGLGLADVVAEVTKRERGRDRRRRRTVSESDTGDRSGLFNDEQGEASEVRAEVAANEDAEEVSRATQRWKWVRKIFVHG